MGARQSDAPARGREPEAMSAIDLLISILAFAVGLWIGRLSVKGAQ
jgi:hypothetical protein